MQKLVERHEKTLAASPETLSEMLHLHRARYLAVSACLGESLPEAEEDSDPWHTGIQRDVALAVFDAAAAAPDSAVVGWLACVSPARVISPRVRLDRFDH